MGISEGLGPLWPLSRRLRRTMLPALAVTGIAVVLAACSAGGSVSNSSSAPSRAVEAAAVSGHVKGSLTIWVDAVRLPVAQAYAKAHPKVHVHIVTFDGDGN